jgi:hypothetical protein
VGLGKEVGSDFNFEFFGKNRRAGTVETGTALPI